MMIDPRLKTIAVAALLATISAPEASACNARGEFCSYPYWAANAFAAPRDRVSEGVFRDRVYRDEYVRETSRKRAHYKPRYRTDR